MLKYHQKEKMSDKKIILASVSSKRFEILTKSGLKFDVKPSQYEEDLNLKLKPKEMVVLFSKNKAIDVTEKCQNSIVIAADTVITSNDKIYGKPHTKERARQMLKELSGKTQVAMTGFTIIDSDSRKTVSKVVETKLTFKNLSEKDIDRYLKMDKPFDKAGGFSTLDLGSVLIKKIEGDICNIAGLPLTEVLDSLEDFGITI